MIKHELIKDLSGVEQTALLTLYNRAMESQSDEPILKDLKAEALVARIDPILQTMDSKMARQLRERETDPKLDVHIALRNKKYDDAAQDYLRDHPDGTIVNIGCGLDTRFYRIDNGQVQFYDLDLAKMIRFKRQLLAETDRYRMIGQSVLDFSWMDGIVSRGQPVLFLAEGVLMYLPEDRVRALVLTLQRRFPGSDLVCELTHRRWVEGIWGKMAQMKMQNRLKMGSDAQFQFGVDSPDALEKWGPGIRFRDMWFYMDEDHPKIGWMRVFRNLKMIRNAQFTVRYTLNALSE
ncbi:class I SAM-dependent methyltransferase [bacterium]|nr:class I SAM-dependent methyltransferase [bacterium]